jgi:hypothetical protein
MPTEEGGVICYIKIDHGKVERLNRYSGSSMQSYPLRRHRLEGLQFKASTGEKLANPHLNKINRAMVSCAYHPSYKEGYLSEDHSLRPNPGKK